ncbi:hypothetical protein Acsp03_69360 [Actinomadura sp. NBRC 104412]|nr:hypothetical protein Acsp03_69360 [Actinomadura sp. NBRC 104412]
MGDGTLMQVQDIGAFIRCLLPVRLTGGHTVTFGLWLAVHPDDPQRAFAVWEAPEYANLTLDGWLANAVSPWGGELLAALAHAVVQDTEQLPYIVRSDHDLSRQVLGETSDHADVLGALPA